MDQGDVPYIWWLEHSFSKFIFQNQLTQNHQNIYPSQICIKQSQELQKIYHFLKVGLNFSLQYFGLVKQKNSLKKSKMQANSKSWAPQEINLLKQAKSSRKPKKWKQIAEIFSKKGWNRSHVQCRNKWVNYVAPQINHKPWTEGELQLLFTSYEKYNSRWSSIQKLLPTRTQTRIKNHFYGVLRGIARFLLKYLKEVPERQTKISNMINPNSLQLIYKGAEQFSFLGDLIPKAIAAMGFRFEKHIIIDCIENNLTKFKKLGQQIVQMAEGLTGSAEQSQESSESFGIQENIQNQHQPQQQNSEEKEKYQNCELVGSPPYMAIPLTYCCNQYSNSNCFEKGLFRGQNQITFIPILYQQSALCTPFPNYEYFMVSRFQ